MNNINKGLKNPLGSSIDCYLQFIFDATIEDYLTLIFDATPDTYFDLIFGDSFVVKDPPKKVTRNETEIWLYDANCENYERVLKVVKNKTPYNRRFTLAEDEIESYFHQYLTEYLIVNNQLKKEIDKGKKIKPNVVYEWFLQYVVREKYQEGQDALQRTRGARTQSEVTKIKAYETKQTDTPYAPKHHIKNLESQGWQVAQVVSKVDAETGHQVGEPDYYVHDDEHLDLEERSENAYMKELLLERFGVNKVDVYYTLWLELRYAEYESKKKWAEARKVSYKVLTSQIEQVETIFKDNLEAFGY
jgi:hypothetical protein